MKGGLTAIAGPTLCGLFGLLLVRMVMLGEHTRYVKPSLGPFLLLTGAFLLFLGVWSLGVHVRGAAGHLPRTAWLLALPVLVVVLANPAPLGAYSASASIPGRPAPGQAPPPLPPGHDIVDLRADLYVIHAVYSDPAPLRGRRFRLVGFVAHPEGSPAPWELARLKVTCCASDATVYRVAALGAEPLPDDTWVEVVGTHEPGPPGTAALRVESVRRVPEPADPYL